MHQIPYPAPLNGTQLEASDQNPGVYGLSFPEPWTFFDIEASETMVIGEAGFTIFAGAEYFMEFDPCLANIYSTNDQASGVYVEFAPNETPARVTVEWQNARIEGSSLFDFVTFRLNIYDNQVIEFHYGASNITGDLAYDEFDGPFSQVSLFSSDFSQTYSELYATQDPMSPTFTGPGTLEAFPQSGTLYRFGPATTTSINENLDNNTFTVYPNPTSDEIQLSDRSIQTVRLLSSDGTELEVVSVENGLVSLKDYPKGIYLIQVLQSNNRNSIQRVVKQ